jgi:hypothetical protein
MFRLVVLLFPVRMDLDSRRLSRLDKRTFPVLSHLVVPIRHVCRMISSLAIAVTTVRTFSVNYFTRAVE